MVRLLLVALILIVSVVGPVSAQELPVKRVTLFSSGVAYYERSGEVDGNVTLELPFKTEQINDILKSLVLQDLGGGRIQPVVYAPKDPIEKALRSFGIDLTGNPTFGQLLDQIRGVPVEIAMPGQSEGIEGVIVGVEKQRTIVDKYVVEDDVLNVLCDDGIHAFKLRDLGRIKLADDKLDAELRRALIVLAGAHDADKKPVVLQFAGEGKRPVRVSYILEAPIWKTSYRLVLDEDKAFLQGWATVDNTTDEDWNDVELTLVSGRPISFIQDLYQPIYIPRPVVVPELYASLMPKRYEGSMELEEMPADASMLGRQRRIKDLKSDESADKRPVVASPQSGGFGGRGGGGFGGGSGFVASEEVRAGVALAGTGVTSLAAATEAGELFHYAIGTPVTLPRQKSAMLPIVNDSVTGEKFSIYNPDVHAKYPLNGLRLENTTPLHLMQGPITVFEDDSYAGDAQLPDLAPDEKRLISYSLDLRREVETLSVTQPEVLTSVRIAKGTLIATREFRASKTYNVKNKDDQARSVLIEHPFRADWDLIEPKDPFERTPTVYRFRVETEPNATAKLVVREQHTGDQQIVLGNTGLDQIQFYLRAKVISPKVREALTQVVEMRTALDETVRRRTELEARTQEIRQDQDRLRENIRTVRQATDLYNRYVEKLEAQETELDRIHEEITRLTQQENQQRSALDQFLLSLSVG